MRWTLVALGMGIVVLGCGGGGGGGQGGAGGGTSTSAAGTGGGGTTASTGTSTSTATSTSSTGTGMGAPLGAACVMDTDCSTGLCYDFNAKGKHCTKKCMNAADCPAPSSGCNGMGICKPN